MDFGSVPGCMFIYGATGAGCESGADLLAKTSSRVRSGGQRSDPLIQKLQKLVASRKHDIVACLRDHHQLFLWRTNAVEIRFDGLRGRDIIERPLQDEKRNGKISAERRQILRFDRGTEMVVAGCQSGGPMASNSSTARWSCRAWAATRSCA